MLRKQLIAALALVTFSGAALAGEKEDAMKCVADAVAAVNKDKTAAVAEMNNPKGRFVKGEIYVFAYDLSGTILAQPFNPKLLGKNMLDVPDATGKMYRKEMIDGVKANGSVTVEYRYKNPVDGKMEDKVSFCTKAADLAICAGYYK
jgi:cytochrome c